MSPTFKNGDWVLINKLSYFFEKPKVRDIVVLKRANFIVKRIVKIKEKEIFVVGDNENESTDSRDFGWVSKKTTIGKAIFKI